MVDKQLNMNFGMAEKVNVITWNWVGVTAAYRINETITGIFPVLDSTLQKYDDRLESIQQKTM